MEKGCKRVRQPDENDELECAICTDVYEEPKLLACMHTFCNKCIGEVLKHGNQDSVTCPKCRYVTKVGGDGKLHLLRNHIMEQKVRWQQVSQMRDGNALQCSDCETEKATMLCTTCQLKLCDFCASYHQRSVRFKSHTVISIEAVSNEELFEKKQIECIVHKQEIKYFCETCQATLCADCLLSKSHQGHIFLSVSEVMDKKLASLKNAIKDSETVFKEYNSYLDRVEEFKKKSDEERDASKKLVEDTFAQLVEILQFEKQKLLNWLDESSQPSADAVKAAKENFNHIQSARDYFKEVVNYPAHEIFDIVQTGASKLQETMHLVKTAGEMKTDASQALKFKPVSDEDMIVNKGGNFEVQLVARQITTKDTLRNIKTTLQGIGDSFSSNQCFFRRAEGLCQLEINNVSQVRDTILSKPITHQNFLWRIMFLPRYLVTPNEAGVRVKIAGIFVKCEPKEKESVSKPWHCTAHCKLILKNHKGDDKIRRLTHDFSEREDDWGYSSYLLWEDLTNPDVGYSKDDSVSIVAMIQVE